MCEENKKFWDESQISAINAWHSSGKSFSQIDEEYNFAVGTLFTIVNAIPDYRGTRSSISKWLRRSSDFKIFAAGDEGLAAVRQSLYEDIVRLSGAVRTLQAGIPLAVRKGAKLIPHHALALSVECAPEAFPRCELPLETALHYLAREAVTLPPETPRGYVIVTFGGHALGFVNNLGPRANNMYPAEWRIRHAAAPENHLKPCNT